MNSVASLAEDGRERVTEVAIAGAPFRPAAEKLTPVLWRIMRRYGVSEAEADDGMQRLLLQLARHWERLALLGEAELRRYACCAAIGMARKLARERARAESAVGQPAAQAHDPLQPDEALERKQAVAIVDGILSAMDEDTRTVFIFFELEGWTAPEISRHLSIPVGTVASRLRKGRETFDAAVSRLRAERKRRGGL
jgi:RNA polymerase sigma-70 factor (ECF subfamily)